MDPVFRWATVRQREMGLRAALGAGRGRLIRQMVTETLLLGVLGGLFGVLLGQWANPGDVSRIASASSSVPVRLDFSFDWRVFAYSFAAALITGVLVGLWPAFRASRADLNAILQEGGRSDTGGAGRHRLRSALASFAQDLVGDHSRERDHAARREKQALVERRQMEIGDCA